MFWLPLGSLTSPEGIIRNYRLAGWMSATFESRISRIDHELTDQDQRRCRQSQLLSDLLCDLTLPPEFFYRHLGQGLPVQRSSRIASMSGSVFCLSFLVII